MTVEFNKPLTDEWLIGLIGETLHYLQFLHVQLLPHLQFSQVQFGLSHFWLSFEVTVLTLIVDFMIFVFNCLKEFDNTKVEQGEPVVITALWESITEFWVSSIRLF